MTISAPDILDEAMRHCRNITRRRARNFYYGLKLLPEPKRSAMYSVYAWMRHADDLADDQRADRNVIMRQIEAFRAATDLALRGDPPSNDLMLTGLAHVAKQYPLDRRHFHAMLDGQLDDLDDRRYETFAALRVYCERVASSVGLVCISIWGYDDPRAEKLAIDRGIAFQLTNILRDLAEDLEAGRCYVPTEVLHRHDLSPDQLRAWSKPAQCEQIITEQVDRARQYYDASATLDEVVEPDAQPTLWAMTEIYRQILAKVAQNPRQTISGPRIRLSAMSKGAIAVRARWRLREQGNGAP